MSSRRSTGYCRLEDIDYAALQRNGTYSEVLAWSVAGNALLLLSMLVAYSTILWCAVTIVRFLRRLTFRLNLFGPTDFQKWPASLVRVASPAATTLQVSRLPGLTFWPDSGIFPSSQSSLSSPTTSLLAAPSFSLLLGFPSPPWLTSFLPCALSTLSSMRLSIS